MSPSQGHSSGRGKLDSIVRTIESADELSVPDFGRKLARDGLDAWMMALALATARSVRPEGADAPLAPSVIQAVRQLVEEAALPSGSEEVRALLLWNLQMVRAEIKRRGPFRLPEFAEAAVGTKEEATYAFLEAVHASEPHTADLRFQGIARDLSREQATDLLLSAGLPKATHRIDNLIAPVESLAQLQWVGWEHAPLLLRPVVRIQASAVGSSEIYDQACHVVSARHLLRSATRRAPGTVALGERDSAGFLRLAMEWAEADGDGRLAVVASALATGETVEDVADAIAIAGTLLFLQEGLRGGGRGWTGREAASRGEMLRATHGLRRMVKIATPGQRILGLLLVGHMHPLRWQLRPGSPESGWWLSPAAKLTEPSNGGLLAAGEAWREAIEQRSSNGLLPALTAEFEAGRSTRPLADTLTLAAVRRRDLPPRALIADRIMQEGYRVTRSPHRWLHLWAAALSYCAWPTLGGEDDLPDQTPSASVQPGSGPVTV